MCVRPVPVRSTTRHCGCRRTRRSTSRGGRRGSPSGSSWTSTCRTAPSISATAGRWALALPPEKLCDEWHSTRMAKLCTHFKQEPVKLRRGKIHLKCPKFSIGIQTDSNYFTILLVFGAPEIVLFGKVACGTKHPPSGMLLPIISFVILFVLFGSRPSLAFSGRR